MISILLAVRNEEDYIEKCLESLLNQDFPKNNYEILVADGNSSDRTRAIVKRISSETKNPKITLLENPEIVPSSGWNVCLKEAKGDFILLFGGHATIPRDFLTRNMKTWNKYSKEVDNLAGIGGRYTIGKFETFTPKLGYVLLNSVFSGSSSHKRIEKPRLTNTVVFGLYKKDIIEKAGGFEDNLKNGGDLEINLRLRKKGYKLLTDPGIQFNYFPRTTFKKMLKQIWNYGIVKGMFLRRGYFIPKALIAPVFLVYALGLFLFSNFTIYLIPAAAYLTLNILFSLFNSIKHRDIRFLIALPFLYFYTHISSGISIIFGCILGKKSLL